MCPEGVEIKTHVLIFEGAGNLLFKDSSSFKLLDVDKKYNTITEFKEIKFGLVRGANNPRLFNSFIARIAKLIKRPTLVVCWKDVEDKKDSPGISEYADRMREALLKKKADPRLFTVTYYGATDNKSTNGYRDIEQIILCEDWNLPNTESAKIRKAYGTRTDSQDHKDWYFSQLITRIGIRKHIKGERYTVFYTDDFNPDFISRMDSYFNRNKIETRNTIKHEDWRIKLDSLNIRKNIKEEIVLLAGSDDKMQKAIIQGKEYRKDVTFDFLELLGITRHDRKRLKYKVLMDNLKRLGITLEIISGNDKDRTKAA